jgi:glucose-6-phosphate dehydrogenase assembly protein OpcA
MIRRALLALALVAAGWVAARAQAPQTPDFELSVTMTADGKATIACVRGCGLQWIERKVPNRADAEKTFTYGCSNAWDRWPNGCPSGRLGGWISK